MNVRELIEALQEFDPETEVIGVDDSQDGPTWVRNVQPDAVKVVRSADRKMYGEDYPVVHEYVAEWHGHFPDEYDPFDAVLIR